MEPTNSGTKRPVGQERREVPPKYKQIQKHWRRHEVVWTFAHYIVGLSAISLAFLAGSKDLLGVITDETAITILTLASGALAVVLTFLSPASKRKAYTEACDLLRITRLRFEGEEKYAEKDLNDAVEQAQQILARR